jgi:hypothetical protein
VTGEYHSHDIDEELEGCCLECPSGLQVIKRHLLHFHERVRDVSADSLAALSLEDLYAFYEELGDLVRLEIDDRTAEALLAEDDVREVLTEIRTCYAFFFHLHERHLAEEVLASGEPWECLERFVFHENYVLLADREVRGAGLRAGDTVTFIGAGSLPLSIMLMSARHGIRAIGLEREPDLAVLADRVVRHLGLASSVEIVQGDHRLISRESAVPDLVMIAAQAYPKADILRHLVDVLPLGRKVLLRTYERGLRRVLAGGSDSVLPEGLAEVCRIEPDPPVNNTIVVAERVAPGS